MYFESNTLRAAGLPRAVSSSMRAVSKSKPELEVEIWLSKHWAFHLEGKAQRPKRYLWMEQGRENITS